MGDSPHIVIRMISNPAYTSVVRAAVQNMAGKMGLDNEATGHVVLAVDEAITNVIRHGYRGQTDRPIWLKLTPLHDRDRIGLEVVIEDESDGVDLSRIKGRPLEEIRPGGLGVHIIQKMMDHVEYSHCEKAKGLKLRMCKWRSRTAPPPSS